MKRSDLRRTCRDSFGRTHVIVALAEFVWGLACIVTLAFLLATAVVFPIYLWERYA